MAMEFVCIGSEYWLRVFPEVRHQLDHWQRRATAIPDPILRRHALATHAAKRSHAEGAAAFAVLAPGRRRSDVVKALVAFQAMYDYLDTVSEQPGPDPLTNGWQLHAALIDALDPAAPHRDYYALHPQADDGGYLHALVDACREACAALPSFPLVAPIVQAAAVRAMQSQGYNHAVTAGMSVEAVTRWACQIDCGKAGLLWWEVVGATGSSLLILALIATAAAPSLCRADSESISAVYFPWAGGLLALMDSLVDQDADVMGGTHSLSGRYRSATQAAERVSLMARRSIQLARDAPQGELHVMIITAMVALFASEPEASLPGARRATEGAVAALGAAATLPLFALRLRRRLAGLRVGRPS
jgi:tetraprenyl-beta-curcumene synthase